MTLRQKACMRGVFIGVILTIAFIEKVSLFGAVALIVGGFVAGYLVPKLGEGGFFGGETQ